MITKDNIEQARARIEKEVCLTPTIYSHPLSRLTGVNVYLKLELLQRTGAFKERGALNKILSLSDVQKKAGVITASAGNHGQAVAYHAGKLGIEATVFMPQGASLKKQAATKAFGGTVILEGENYEEAYAAAQRNADEMGRVFVHAYNDPDVIAGQGTVGLEILDQIPGVNGIVTAVGGGGLLSGIAVAIGEVKDMKLFGAEPEGFDCFAKAHERGEIFTLCKSAAGTLADGAAAKRAGELAFGILDTTVSKWLVLNEEEIAHAILYMMENHNLVVEGAGALGVGAILKHPRLLKESGVSTACVVVSGGNIDINLLGRIIDRGLAAGERQLKMRADIADKPGFLAELLCILKECNANVLDIRHERSFSNAPVGKVGVELVLETQGRSHGASVLEALKKAGVYLHTLDPDIGVFN